MISRVGKHILRTKSKPEIFGLFALYPCFLFICYLAAPWLFFGNYWGNSPTKLMLIIAFGLSTFGPKVTRRGWSLLLTECPLGFDHNDTTRLLTHPKLQKILSPGLHPVFPKCGNALYTQNSYSLTLWWHLGLQITSMDAKFSVQNFSFCSIKSMS